MCTYKTLAMTYITFKNLHKIRCTYDRTVWGRCTVAYFQMEICFSTGSVFPKPSFIFLIKKQRLKQQY